MRKASCEENELSTHPIEFNINIGALAEYVRSYFSSSKISFCIGGVPIPRR